MYMYQRSVGAFHHDLEGLQLLTIENAKLSSVVKNTRLFFITVYDTITLETYNVDMNHYRNETLYWDQTIQQWLNNKEDVPLKRYDGLIGDRPYYVRMEDLQMAGYNVVPARFDLAEDYQSKITSSGAKDLRLYHLFEPKPKYLDFVKTTLFTWNGYFNRAVAREDGIYLLGAGEHFKTDDHGHVGGIDFSGISSLKTLPIKLEDVTFASPNLIDIKLDKEVNHETVWVVLAGKLIPNYRAIRRVNSNVVSIDLRMLNLTHWVLESSKRLHLPELPISKHRTIKHDDLWSEETIGKLLTHISSFLVVLSNPYMGIQVEPLETFTYPTTFLTHDSHHHPVMLNNGRFPTYRSREGSGNRRLLDFDIRYNDLYINDYTGRDNGGDLYHDRVNWLIPHTPVTAYHFKIYSVIKGL